MKVLVVDDSRDIRLLLTTILRSWGWEVIQASDGVEAWEILQREPIRLVISDWMMPHMDGTELSRRIRAARLAHYVYIILVTSRDEKEDFVEGMESGADDFVVKPLDMDELRVRLRAAERILRLEGELEQRNQKLSEANQALTDAYALIRRDLEAAARMQRSLLPQAASSIGGVRFSGLFCPSLFVAGDIFNFFALDERHVGFYLLDVSGHGVQSAMLSVTLSKLLSPHAEEGSPLKRLEPGAPQPLLTPPEEVMTALNRRFQFNHESMLYFTMIYGIIDRDTNVATLSQAGHPNPILLRAGDAATQVGEGGLPVGLFSEGVYDAWRLQLQPGDRLFLYSDGVTDCAGPSQLAYSEPRLRAFLEQHRRLPLAGCLAALEEELRRWRGSEQFEDDVSLLALELA